MRRKREKAPLGTMNDGPIHGGAKNNLWFNKHREKERERKKVVSFVLLLSLTTTKKISPFLFR